MASRIICVSGKKNTGKNTIVNIIKTLLPVTEVAFADPIKEFLHSTLGVDKQLLWGPSNLRETLTHLKWENVHPEIRARFYTGSYPDRMTVREALQLVGSEIMPLLNKSIWVDKALEKANKSSGVVVISDMRRVIELNAINALDNKLVIRVRREVDNADNHSSESELDFLDKISYRGETLHKLQGKNVDYVLFNRDLATLTSDIKTILKDIV